MKIIVTGSLGHISKPLAQELIRKGHTVTVISSQAGKQKEIEQLGASAAIGSLENAQFLTDTFTGADAVYSMTPPNDYFNHDLDLMAFYRSVADSYAEAIRQSGVKRVVHLSSIGAHLDKGTGLILGHHAGEAIMNSLPADVGITFMRPTAFYYNLYGFLGTIKKKGMIAANYGGADRVVWVAPADIAAAVAEEIVTPLAGRKIRYVTSEELTGNEIAGILGAAIGKPELEWLVISDEEMRKGLEEVGMSPRIAAGLVELNASMRSGELFQDYYLHRPEVMGNVKMTDFAKEFAAAFHK